MEYESKLDFILTKLRDDGKPSGISWEELLDMVKSDISDEHELSQLLTKLKADGNIECEGRDQIRININGKMLLENGGYTTVCNRGEEMYKNSKIPIIQNNWIIFLTILGIAITLSIFIFGILNTGGR